MMTTYTNLAKGAVAVKLTEDVSDLRSGSNAEECTKFLSRQLIKENIADGNDNLALAIGLIADHFAEARMKQAYVGKAKVSGNDEYDPDFGRDLAKARCLEKYYRDLYLASEDMVAFLDDMISFVVLRRSEAIDSAHRWMEKENELVEQANAVEDE